MTVQQEKHNAAMLHNADITARPRILFPATGATNDGLVLRMSSAGPEFEQADLDGKQLHPNWGIEQFESVREFTANYLMIGSAEHKEMESATTTKDRETLKALSLLQYAHTSANATAAKKAIGDAASLLIDNPALRAIFATGKPREVANWFYPAFFTREMNGARMVIWRTKHDAFVPAVLCPSLRAASFVAAAFRVVAACPNCFNLFVLDSQRLDGSASEKYCTAACGQRYRQKLYRIRVSGKQRNRAKKSTKSKRRRKKR